MDTQGNGARRPEHVIVLDADDPMIEIEGRIVWQEAHERIVAEARDVAFREGYDAGLREAARPAQVVRFKRRRTIGQWFAIVVVATMALIFLLMLPVLLQK